MTMRKKKPFAFVSSFLAFVILCTSLTVIFPLSAFAEGENTVTVDTNAEVKQGDFVRCSVYIDSLAGLSALDVSVHFDPDKVSVSSTYNRATAVVYDSSVQEDCVQYTYIFDGKGVESKTQIFYFYYTVKSTAEPGKTYFDVTVSDAYDAGLSPVDVRGSRTSVTVLEKPVPKTCSISAPASVSTSVENEFELSYQLSTYQIASGSFAIRYDPDLFEVVSVTNGNFLDGKVTDINTELDGAVYVSFISTEYNYYSGLLSVKFKTKKNVTEKSQIKLAVSDLYDLELTPISCSGYATSVNLIYDSAYDDSLAKIFLTSTYDAANNQVRMLVKLSANTHLGAGDFALNWDTTYLRVASYEKKFSPTFFNVNDKQTGTGILKFSIISLSDITEATDVLCLTFDVLKPHDETSTGITVSGSGLSDSLTNPICFNFVGCNQTIPGEHKFGEWYQSKTPTCTEKGEERRDCEICDYYETRETDIVSSNHDYAAVVTTATLDLAGKIGVVVSFYIPDDILADDGAYVEMSYNGIATETKRVLLKNGSYDSENDRYYFTFPVAVMEIYETVSFKMFDGKGNQIKLVKGKTSRTPVENDTFTYAAIDYITSKKSSSDPKTAALVSRLEELGKLARLYFSYKSSEVIEPGIPTVNMTALSEYASSLSGTNPTGLKIATATLDLNSDTSIIVTFRKTEGFTDIGNYTFTCDGAPITVQKENDTDYAAYITGISSKELDAVHVVTLSDGTSTRTLNYSALSYAYYNANKTPDEIVGKLCKALYSYNLAADAYFAA